MRVVPDIAADADLATGVLIGETIDSGTSRASAYIEQPGGGTSVSCPLIAGLQADAEQAAGGVPIGFANPAIYARYGTSDYHDVTDRPSGAAYPLAVAVPPDLYAPSAILVTLGTDLGLSATPGYDDVTGVGTPTAGYFASYR